MEPEPRPASIPEVFSLSFSKASDMKMEVWRELCDGLFEYQRLC
jgi:hypothetical protein